MCLKYLVVRLKILEMLEMLKASIIAEKCIISERLGGMITHIQSKLGLTLSTFYIQNEIGIRDQSSRPSHTVILQY